MPRRFTTSVIAFGRFKLVPHRRELLADDQPVELGGRAFDVLMALVEAHGSVLSKDELLKRVWPERVVEEKGLQVQISTLRKVFGRERDLIRTIAGHGYQFTGKVRDGANESAALAAPLLAVANVPEPATDHDVAVSAIEFGRFEILPHRRELLADGAPVELGGRAFDVLMALVEAHGYVLSKNDLMARVWPGRVVEESGLQVQISTLRKALGSERDLIRTVAGRGYQFVGDVRGITMAAAPVSPLAPSSVLTNLPKAVSELIGRDAELRSVSDLLLTHRLITLTGAGGIGKTRLAIEVARQMLPRNADGVWIAELGPLTDPALVPSTVATALRLTLNAEVVTPELIATALGARRILLVLDNCEHVIEAVARMCDALLSASSVICVMVTSREPLRTGGEWVYPVPALEFPAEGTKDAEELQRCSAVRLFIARARAVAPHFYPDQHMAEVIGSICRRLDGIPLAIELAAARAPALGVDGLASRLDDRFSLLTGGLRTALPRHQTLRATLDWSYDLLPKPERVILSRLAIFAGWFTLDSAGAVVSDADIPSSEVVDDIVNLVAKSLVTVDVGRPHVQYRLLETTRVYALQKLADGGDRERFARRHAEYQRDTFERAADESKTRPPAEWLMVYGGQVDNLRAALDWASSPSGDAAIATALIIAAVPLWFQLSMMEECRQRVEWALEEAIAVPAQRTREHMMLFTALGAAILQTMGTGAKPRAAWNNALEIAERFGDTDYALRALRGLWATCITAGDPRSGQDYAQRFQALADRSGSRSDVLIGDRILGMALHYQGDQASARQHIERMLNGYADPSLGADAITRFQFDQRIIARAYHARILWLQGFSDQAIREAESCIDEAEVRGHALSLCYALVHGVCPVTLYAGDFFTANRFVTMLLDESARVGLHVFHAIGEGFRGILMMKRGDPDAGPRILRKAIDDLNQREFPLMITAFLGALAEGLIVSGQIAEGLATIDDALARCEQFGERWCLPELLRVKGELELHGPSAEPASEAANHFLQAMDWARRQSAPTWELRAATSLAHLCQQQNRNADAHEVLAPVYGQFTEGFGTPDRVAAKALLDAVE
jgi:predicted ATPase/DNA-binding winged helix-turn-helix (wHTH) protein